jgi:hypothetical protein
MAAGGLRRPGARRLRAMMMMGMARPVHLRRGLGGGMGLGRGPRRGLGGGMGARRGLGGGMGARGAVRRARRAMALARR